MPDEKKLRIVFAGTPDFAVPPLRALIDSPHTIQAVLTQPDRPAGRGRRLQQSPVKTTACTTGIPVWQPGSLRDEQWQQRLIALEPDLVVVVAYGLILPQAVLDIPRHGCWNIHASLLPRWRGAAPIQRAIQAGDRQTGVCIMHMEAGLDTGPIYACRTTPVDINDTAGTLHDRLAYLGAETLVECVQRLTSGSLPAPRPQAEEGITYAHKVTPDEAEIDWRLPAENVVRHIHAFNPWPGARTMLAGTRIKIWKAAISDMPLPGHATPGMLLRAGKDQLLVAAADGAVAIEEVQQPGKKRLPVTDFLNAHRQRLSDFVNHPVNHR